MGPIRRRELLKLGACAALGAGCSVRRNVTPGRSIARRPNILVFLTDDHGQWAQRSYGNSEIRSPNLDRLAARGMRLTRAYTPCPVCSPARASFFTGRMPSQHGIHDWIEETTHSMTHPGLRGQTLISELLKDAGYHTGLIGKWHCGRTREPQQGFDRWFSYWVSQYPHQGTQNFSDQGKHVIEEGAQSPLLTDRAIEFVRDHHRNRARGEQPFFLFVSYVDTHSPHDQAPPELVSQYADASFRDIPDERLPACHGRALTPASDRWDFERSRRADYYAAVSSIDREVGRVLVELESIGQLDHTLIVYTADHGYNAGHHGIWEKGNGTLPQNFFDESIRVPCTISWPAGGVRQGTTCSDAVSHCDLWATLLEIAHAQPSTKLARQIDSPGRSYLRQLRGLPGIGEWNIAICEYGNARMIRDERFKLIRRYPYGGVRFSDELYDLRNDPRETINRMEDSSLEESVNRLDRQMNRFFDRYTVPGHSGLDLAHQPECTPASPWLLAVAEQKHLETQPATAPGIR